MQATVGYMKAWDCRMRFISDTSPIRGTVCTRRHRKCLNAATYVISTHARLQSKFSFSLSSCNYPMPPSGTHELSPSKRSAICALYSAGYSYCKIAKKMNIAHSTAHYTVKCDRQFHTRHSLPRSGHPPTLTKRKKCMILREVRKNQKTPYKGIAEAVGDVTEQQVRKVANSAGYHCRIARRKPFLTQEVIKKHYAWARENKTRDWDTVICTDETRLELGERPGRECVTQKAGEEFLLEQLEVCHAVGMCGTGQQGTTHPA